MAEYPLTDAQIMQLAYRVRGLIRAESRSVPEIPLVDTLNGIESLPVVQNIGGVYKYVRAAISLLSQPSWDAVKNYTDELKTATAEGKAATKASVEATAAARSATSQADTAATLAAATIARLEELADQLVAQYKLQPESMMLSFPSRITLRNTEVYKIGVHLLPVDALQNVLFLGDDKAVSVLPDGAITVNGTGTSVIHVIPPENTKIYRTIRITVVEPALRKIKSNSLRLMGNGNFRLT